LEDFNMRSQPPFDFCLPRAALLAALGLVAAAALPAAAEDVVYGPDGAPTVLQHKLYPMSQQWELGVRLAAGLNQPLVVDYGGSLSLSYHPNESFDIGGEVYGGYTALSSLADVIREKLPARNPMTPKDEIANSDQLRFGFAVRSLPDHRLLHRGRRSGRRLPPLLLRQVEPLGRGPRLSVPRPVQGGQRSFQT